MKLLSRILFRLKLSILCSSSLFILFLSTAAHADRQALAVTNIEFILEIREWSCKIKNSSQNMVVDLGIWNTQNFNTVGSQTRPRYFEVELEDCDVEQVAMSFTGPADANNPDYLAIHPSSSAKHVAVQISDHNQVPLPLNTVSPALSVNQNNSNILSFYANFISTQERIQAGHASADATLVLHYN